MTTLTIDTPLKLKKTHFKSPLELISFFSQLMLKQAEKTIVDNDPDRTQVTEKNKKAYQQAMKNYEKGDVYDINDLRSMLAKR